MFETDHVSNGDYAKIDQQYSLYAVGRADAVLPLP